MNVLVFLAIHEVSVSAKQTQNHVEELGSGNLPRKWHFVSVLKEQQDLARQRIYEKYFPKKNVSEDS